MCGIAGVVAPDSRGYRDNLRKMVDALRSRGPDGSGMHFFDECALGHSRLCIVDPETGAQPMLSAVSNTGITFNGEIYGYREIRACLDDYPLRTASDTEVILALHARYGHGLPRRVPGMFAFAIWDDSRRELFCARDRFGEKPFFFAFGKKGEFLFASEIKALIASGLISPVLSRPALAHYLRRLYVHPRQTIYENVHVLPPAHSLTYRNGNLSVERYWELPVTQEEIHVDEAVGELRRLFDAAVARQLVADVPVGVFLSGGLDSSTIVAAASRHQARVKTFFFEFEEGAAEKPYAREVSGLYGTEHVELVDHPVDIGALLPCMAEVYDEPFADSSNIPTWLLSKRAREYVKVVLTGDGGDELLAGYDQWYRPLLFMEREKESSLWRIALFRLASAMIERRLVPGARAWKERSGGASYRRRFGTLARAHATRRAYFDDDEIARLGVGAHIGEEYLDIPEGASDTVDDALRMDLGNYLPGDILVKTDRASMAHGLELRAPFLDAELASFLVSLPSRMKIDSAGDKILLRRAFSGEWPPSVRNRGKMGFGAPVHRWLARESVRALKGRYLDDPGQKIFSILSFEHTRKAVLEDNYKTWILLVLSLWMDRHEFRTSGKER